MLKKVYLGFGIVAFLSGVTLHANTTVPNATVPPPPSSVAPTVPPTHDTNPGATPSHDVNLSGINLNNKPSNAGISNADLLRQELHADETLSEAAQKVKITTVGKRLNIAGTVNSIAEKNVILQKAKKIAGTGNVEDHIQVMASR